MPRNSARYLTLYTRAYTRTHPRTQVRTPLHVSSRVYVVYDAACVHGMFHWKAFEGKIEAGSKVSASGLKYLLRGTAIQHEEACLAPAGREQKSRSTVIASGARLKQSPARGSNARLAASSGSNVVSVNPLGTSSRYAAPLLPIYSHPLTAQCRGSSPRWPKRPKDSWRDWRINNAR